MKAFKVAFSKFLKEVSDGAELEDMEYDHALVIIGSTKEELDGEEAVAQHTIFLGPWTPGLLMGTLEKTCERAMPMIFKLQVGES